eukprot:TRINITY_DN4113_c0_g1_i1.p1 TRINITY_DN4113_c0_g1~~TRINITY_DN4113_c0_g1_i1.p1  ORF type:complete len:262 (+),score=114.73 TRINITY_DN4113_c0_g1_i1:73-786(+)
MLPSVGKYEEEWQNGITKVFLREPMYAKLEDQRNHVLSFSAIKCQSWWKMLTVRSFYMEFKASNVTVQRHIRAYLARKSLTKARESSVHLQSVARMLVQRKKYKVLLEHKREEERKRREEEERRRKKEEEELKRKAEEMRKAAGDNRPVEEILADLKVEAQKKKQEEETKRIQEVEAKLEAGVKEQEEAEAAAEAAAAAAVAASSKTKVQKKKKKKKVVSHHHHQWSQRTPRDFLVS